MANTLTIGTVTRGNKQFQGIFKEMWHVNATVTDTDAVAVNDTLAMTMAVPGVALGDVVIGGSIADTLTDGTDFASLSFAVSAADVVTMYIHADVGEFALDVLNGAAVKVLVGRPNW